MSIFNKNKSPARLNKVEPTHHKWASKDTLIDLWETNKGLFGVIIVLLCISILLVMMGYAAATGHIHFLSTEANVYEHLVEVI